MEKEAAYYKKFADGGVQCNLCPHNCIIKPGRVSICRGRVNRNGTLYAANYGKTISVSLDPIEKKPLYHFYPGKQILSIGPNGCNLSCVFCQNWTISQEKAPTEELPPEAAVRMAKQYSSIGIAYTYTEPVIWFEYIRDTATLVRKAGMVNVLVTNGYINPEPLNELLPYIDAMNIDLKSSKNEFYKKLTGGTLEPVLNSIIIASKKTHIELTNLIIPEENDTPEEIAQLVDFVASVNKKIPLHFSRYFPAYKLTNQPTPAETLRMAYEIAKKKLDYVYIGNALIDSASDTFCPNCNSRLISRFGFKVSIAGIKNGRCTHCNSEVDIIGAP